MLLPSKSAGDPVLAEGQRSRRRPRRKLSEAAKTAAPPEINNREKGRRGLVAVAVAVAMAEGSVELIQWCSLLTHLSHFPGQAMPLVYYSSSRHLLSYG